MKKKMLTCVVAVLTIGLAYGGDVCRSKIDLDLVDASDGKADVRVRDDGRASFNVEVEDLLPPGAYSVCVAGVEVGVINTVTIGSNIGIGAIDFDSDPDEVADGDADDVLNFDVIGEDLTIVQGPCADPDPDTVRLGPTTLECDD